MAGQKLLKRQYEAVLWDAQAVAQALCVSQRTLWRWVESGAFPGPDLAVGAKVRRWKRAAVLAWIESQGVGNGR